MSRTASRVRASATARPRSRWIAPSPTTTVEAAAGVARRFLVEHFGHGNRSEFLRLAVRDYQGRLRLERLHALREQARAERGGRVYATEDVQALIRETNSAADAVSLAFASRFRLFASPHILRNIARVMRAIGQTGATVGGFVTAVGVPDHEDDLIAALVKDPAVDALILVTSDRHLLDPGSNWNGRLVMRPHDFVRRVVAR